MEIDSKVLAAVRRLSKRLNLPSPTYEIGDGREGVVYASTKRGVAIKITKSMRSYILVDMQGPGVIKIYHHEELERKDRYGDDDNFLIIWMERLRFTGSAIFEALGIPYDGIGEQIESDLEVGSGPIESISGYKAFQALNDLMSQEDFDSSDMGLRQVGLNSKGEVVLFDI